MHVNKNKRIPTVISLCVLYGMGMLFIPHLIHANTQTMDPITNILPAIVIIESEYVEYVSPYNKDREINPLHFFLFPKHPIKNDIQGNGIKHKQIFGSGVFLQKDNEKYYIITNYHVIENSGNIIVTTYDGTLHTATLEGTDEFRDIAIISIPTTQPYPLIPLGTTNTITIGMPVYVIGSPFGFTFSISKGIVSALNHTDSTMDNIFIQTDAAMNPGNSGGALINEKGQLIGISTWIYSTNSSVNIGINFASSIDIALDISKNIIQGTKVSYGWIGIIYDSFTIMELINMGIPYRFGSVITNMVKDSPAHARGLKIGDVLVSVNNQKVHAFNSTVNNTKALISTVGSDKDVDITVLRNKKEMIVRLRTEEAPELDTLHEVTARLWPGMTVVPLPNYKKELMGLSENNAALIVTAVYPDTPADYSGIEVDHIITKLNGAAITEYDQYLKTVNTAINTQESVALELFENGYYVDSMLQWHSTAQ